VRAADKSFTAKAAKDTKEQVKLHRKGRKGRKGRIIENQGREDNAKWGARDARGRQTPKTSTLNSMPCSAAGADDS
jgi:hypothetical protein